MSFSRQQKKENLVKAINDLNKKLGKKIIFIGIKEFMNRTDNQKK